MKSTAQFHNPATGRVEHLFMKGSFWDNGGQIVDESTGQSVAVIDRKWTWKDLGGGNTSVLTVAENVDLALMTAMCICLDERRESRNQAAAAS